MQNDCRLLVLLWHTHTQRLNSCLSFLPTSIFLFLSALLCGSYFFSCLAHNPFGVLFHPASYIYEGNEKAEGVEGINALYRSGIAF